VLRDHRVMHYCSECNEKVVNVLIPPVLIKKIDVYPSLRNIWNTAAQEVRAAEHLIIWGYSFPSTDLHSKWLIRQARNGKLRRLTIINPSVISKSKKSLTAYSKNVLGTFKGVLKHEAASFYESFADYINGDEVQRKYSLRR
jgi:hypothetical protein